MIKSKLEPSKKFSKLVNDQIKWISFLNPSKYYSSKNEKILKYLLSKDKKLEPREDVCKVVQNILAKANKYYDSGEYVRAVELYDDVLRLNPINEVALFNKASALSEKKYGWSTVYLYEGVFHEKIRRYENKLLREFITENTKKIETLKKADEYYNILAEVMVAAYILGKRENSFQAMYGDVENYRCLLRAPKDVQNSLPEKWKNYHLKHQPESPKSLDDLAGKYDLNYIG